MHRKNRKKKQQYLHNQRYPQKGLPAKPQEQKQQYRQFRRKQG